jgi:hypothetical protein
MAASQEQMMKIRGWGDEGIISIFRRKMTIKGC